VNLAESERIMGVSTAKIKSIGGPLSQTGLIAASGIRLSGSQSPRLFEGEAERLSRKAALAFKML
jgi:hypothetical protein